MTTRRLAAILAADVVGFSAMMEKDEEGTLARIKALQREVIESKVKQRGGRLVKTTGDGFLCEFGSPVEAVRCALEVQGAARNGPGESLLLRIGINLSHDERVDCLCYGDWAKFACSTVLLRRGALPSGLRVLLSGEALVSIRGRPVATLEAGDVFGEMSFALARPATADVVATTEVSVLVMRPQQLERLMEHHPRLAGALYRSLATELARRMSLRLVQLQRQAHRESGTRKRHRSVLSGAKGSIY